MPEYTYEIVHIYHHDPTAFTEGLFYLNGYLYESTGIKGQSSIRKVRIETGEVIQRYDVDKSYFGEGIVNWKDFLIQVTYQGQVGFVYDLRTFRGLGRFSYSGEAWGVTQDGTHIIMSDGTPQIRFLEPQTFRQTSQLTVTDNGRPVWYLNELEWVHGEIYSNVWQSDRIARIDPKNGTVLGWINLSGIISPEDRMSMEHCLNGIAYDGQNDRLFVTGKCWPKLFEIRVIRRSAQTSR